MKEYKMPTTKEEYIAEHRKMWNWIADESIKNHCKKNKLQYLRHIGVDPKSINTKCWMWTMLANKLMILKLYVNIVL